MYLLDSNTNVCRDVCKGFSPIGPGVYWPSIARKAWQVRERRAGPVSGTEQNGDDPRVARSMPLKRMLHLGAVAVICRHKGLAD